jgi:hypothetical protein
MKKFIIEREVAGASKLSAEELQAIAQTSNAALDEMDVPYHWVQTFVAGDKLYCIHVAEDADTILEHARRGGFPANLVSEVTTIIDSTTAG